MLYYVLGLLWPGHEIKEQSNIDLSSPYTWSTIVLTGRSAALYIVMDEREKEDRRRDENKGRRGRKVHRLFLLVRQSVRERERGGEGERKYTASSSAEPKLANSL